MPHMPLMSLSNGRLEMSLFDYFPPILQEPANPLILQNLLAVITNIDRSFERFIVGIYSFRKLEQRHYWSAKLSKFCRRKYIFTVPKSIY